MHTRKLQLYLAHVLRSCVPSAYCRRQLTHLLAQTHLSDAMQQRLDYYNKCNTPFSATEHCIKNFRLFNPSSYYVDLVRYLRYFCQDYTFNCLFGDNKPLQNTPTLVKTRPINQENVNAVLMKLDSTRHFRFINDPIAFNKKISKVIWRGSVLTGQKHRVKLVNQYYDNAYCDIGQINPTADNQPDACQKDFLSIQQQMQYKYILSIEGNDIATNLKWAMSTNSVILMCKPRHESWFMEGKLVNGTHYIQLRDDYADLEEKIAELEQNPQLSEHIIQNAHAWVKQFLNPKTEKLFSLLVLNKYFSFNTNCR